MPDGAPVDRAARPLSVTAAGLILLTVCVFTGLIGLVLLIVVMVNANPGALPAYADAVPEGFVGAASAIGLGLVAYGVAGAVAGVQALRGRAWARGIGIVLAGVGVGALVLAMIRPGATTGATPLIFAPVIGALVYALVALVTEGGWFTSTIPDSGTG